MKIYAKLARLELAGRAWRKGFHHPPRCSFALSSVIALFSTRGMRAFLVIRLAGVALAQVGIGAPSSPPPQFSNGGTTVYLLPATQLPSPSCNPSGTATSCPGPEWYEAACKGSGLLPVSCGGLNPSYAPWDASAFDAAPLDADFFGCSSCCGAGRIAWLVSSSRDSEWEDGIIFGMPATNTAGVCGTSSSSTCGLTQAQSSGEVRPICYAAPPSPPPSSPPPQFSNGGTTVY